MMNINAQSFTTAGPVYRNNYQTTKFQDNAETEVAFSIEKISK